MQRHSSGFSLPPLSFAPLWYWEPGVRTFLRLLRYSLLVVPHHDYATDCVCFSFCGLKRAEMGQPFADDFAERCRQDKKDILAPSTYASACPSRSWSFVAYLAMFCIAETFEAFAHGHCIFHVHFRGSALSSALLISNTELARHAASSMSIGFCRITSKAKGLFDIPSPSAGDLLHQNWGYAC